MPNWSSKPSAVLPSGESMMPALFTTTFSLSVFSRTVLAHARTLSRELRSSCISSTVPLGLITSASAFSPFLRSREVAKTRAPVAARALAVSMPIPDEVPVTRKTLSERAPSRLSSCTICRAVGRESPGPLVLTFV